MLAIKVFQAPITGGNWGGQELVPQRPYQVFHVFGYEVHYLANGQTVVTLFNSPNALAGHEDTVDLYTTDVVYITNEFGKTVDTIWPQNQD